MNDLERIWRKSIVAQFKVEPGHLPGSTEKNNENLQSG
jgi:hypothetical protein